MQPLVIFGIFAALAVLVGLGVYSYLTPRTQRESLRSLMGQKYSDDLAVEPVADFGGEVPSEKADVPLSRNSSNKNKEPTLEEKLFRAGLFTEEQRQDFRRLQILLPVLLVLSGAGLGSAISEGLNVIIFAFAGGVAGTYIPLWRLSSWMKRRDDDISFYLPLVIEQISIGVSSSLDIGPCLSMVVTMAEDRDSHNPVTELLRLAQSYIKSGVNFQDALTEVGRLSGHNDVKHSFKALAQVARYGGEISKQLQDLSEAVSASRETAVEAKIKKLELNATAPVALVFFGFIIIILIGFGTILINALSH
jgi:Flp pilus assembly protein TadB